MIANTFSAMHLVKMGRDLSDDGWSGSHATSKASTVNRTRNVEEKMSTASHHTNKSFFGGLTKFDSDSSSDDSWEGELFETAKALSNASSKLASPSSFNSGAPLSNIFGGPKEIEWKVKNNEIAENLIEFSSSSHSTVNQDVISRPNSVLLNRSFTEKFVEKAIPSVPASTPYNAGLQTTKSYLQSGFEAPKSFPQPAFGVSKSLLQSGIEAHKAFPQQSFGAPSNITQQPRPNNVNTGFNQNSGFFTFPKAPDTNKQDQRILQKEPSGFQTFGKQYQNNTPTFTINTTTYADTRKNTSSINAGFGKSPATSAGYMQQVKSEYTRTASTFIPPEIKPEFLFRNRIKPGERFNEYFNTNVDITRCGLKNTTRIDRITSFDDIHLTQEIRNNIKICEYEHPTPVQEHTMPLISEGCDLLACAQTGCGKTAAFLLPIISKLLETKDIAGGSDIVCSPRCLIITPTRELTVQIHDEGRKFAFNAEPQQTGIQVKAIYGGTSVDFQRKDIKGATILVATVGRLMHFLQDGSVILDRIKFLVLDEADRMLDMGFGEQIVQIMDSLPSPDKRQTLMFSATFPSEVQVIAQKLLKNNYTMVTVDKIGIASRCVQQEFHQVEQVDKKDLLLKLLDIDLETYCGSLKSGVFQQKTIIFVSTKTFADTLGALLCDANVPSTTIHGNRDQAARSEAVRDLISGRKAVLIATGVAERGLDIRGVDHVINFDLPHDIESYIHRIGRTGRVGNPGKATSFFSPADTSLAPELARVLREVGQPVPPFLETHGGGVLEVQMTTSTVDVADECW